MLPENTMLRTQMAAVFDRILPSNVVPVLGAYFVSSPKSPQTTGALLASAVVSISGAAGIMATLMEGFRRAHDLPANAVSFWRKRARSLALVPLSLVPMSLASGLVVFGYLISQWLVAHAPHSAERPVYLVASLLRWGIALSGSVGILAVIYHLGTDLTKHMRDHIEPFRKFHMDWSWRSSLPGAALATLMWFASTLLFGLYVTRFANYSRVYGPLGAGVALLFWLYLIAISVLFGAEYNAQLNAVRNTPSPEVQTLPPADRPEASRLARQVE